MMCMKDMMPEKPEKKDCMPKCETEKATCAKMEKPKDMEFEKFMYSCVEKTAMKQPKGECMMCMKDMMPEKPEKKDCMPKCETEKATCAKMEKPKDMEFEKFMYSCVEKTAMKQ